MTVDLPKLSIDRVKFLKFYSKYLTNNSFSRTHYLGVAVSEEAYTKIVLMLLRD